MTLDLSKAAAGVLLAVATALAPAPDQSISEYVEGRVMIPADSGSPRPGLLSFAGVEYVREPLDKLHTDDPETRVTALGSAQSAKSLIGQAWTAWKIKNNPRPLAIGLPSIGEAQKYNRLKLQCVIDATPELREEVYPVSSRDEQGSTNSYKRLRRGGFIQIFALSSPKELQMISAGDLILEEVANTSAEVGSRGAPIKQARERQAAFSALGSKELMVSTPGMKGECPVTEAYEASDRRRYYGECPHCLSLWPLEPEGLKDPDGATGPHFICPAAGCVLEEKDRAPFIRNGLWVPTFTSADETNPAPAPFLTRDAAMAARARPSEGRHCGYYIWQAMCGLISWSKITATRAEAKTPGDLIALEQQVYGRAYDPSIEALNWEDLHKLREQYTREIVPSGYGLLTGFADIGGAYIEWGVLGWGPGAEWTVVDRGVIEGDTSGDAPWHQLDEVVRKVYPHADGGVLPIEAFGVDTGFRTQRCYAFTRGRPTCWAMDGRPGWKVPILGKPSAVRLIQDGRVIGRTKLWPSGTWELKSLLAWSLKRSIEAGYTVRVQGRGHWSLAEDEAWAQQITAEALHEEKNKKTGQTDRYWKKIRTRNEWVDIWVGARALAWSLGVGAPRRDKQPGEAIDWTARLSARAPLAPQTELFQAPPAAPGIVTADAAQPAPPPSRTRWHKRG